MARKGTTTASAAQHPKHPQLGAQCKATCANRVGWQGAHFVAWIRIMLLCMMFLKTRPPGSCEDPLADVGSLARLLFENNQFAQPPALSM